jgi:hypothetical protein
MHACTQVFIHASTHLLTPLHSTSIYQFLPPTQPLNFHLQSTRSQTIPNGPIFNPRTHACMHARMHTCTLARTYSCMHSCKQARIHSCMHAFTHSTPLHSTNFSHPPNHSIFISNPPSHKQFPIAQSSILDPLSSIPQSPILSFINASASWS